MRVKENGLNFGFVGDGERIGARPAIGEGERAVGASGEVGMFSCWLGRGGSGGRPSRGVGDGILSAPSPAVMGLGPNGFLWIGALDASGCGSESRELGSRGAPECT